jgi:hypothetical protein
MPFTFAGGQEVFCFPTSSLIFSITVSYIYLAKIANRSSSGDRTSASFQSALCKEPNSNLHCRNFRDTTCRPNLIQSLLLARFGALFVVLNVFRLSKFKSTDLYVIFYPKIISKIIISI